METKDITLICCLIFGVFLLFKEWKRQNKSNLIWRILASILMITSFTLLIIPITYTKKEQGSAHELNLITAGTEVDSISKIKGSKYEIYADSLVQQKRLKIVSIADLSYHLKQYPSIRKINIYGYGLENKDLNLLKDYSVSFHPAIIPAGIISCNWAQQLKASAVLKVQGTYHNPSNKRIKLKLFGFGTDLDSAVINPESTQKFSLKNSPKQVGKAIFNLIAHNGNDTLTVDPIPFEVKDKQKAKVLILASFPDFEYKFLKNWLYENQYPVAFRSQISKAKYSTDFLNMEEMKLDHLNQALLKNIDLLVIDEEELTSISAAERSAIYGAVENGLGLIVRVTSLAAGKFFSSFNRYEVLSPLGKTTSLKLVTENLTLSSLPFAQNLFLKASPNHQAVITDEKGKITVNRELRGVGRVSVSTVSSTYQWQLIGKTADYALFWTTLFSKTARRETSNQSFEIIPQFGRIKEKTRLIINRSNTKIPTIMVEGMHLSLRQNMALPFRWDGYFWPKIEGWNMINLDGNQQSLFIYKKLDWIAAKNNEKLNHNLNFMANQANKDLSSMIKNFEVKKEVNKWWFFIAFLIAVSFLWYEQRFLANS